MSFILLFVACCQSAVQGDDNVEAVRVKIDPRVIHDINGQDTIPQDIFGISAYGARTICESPKMVRILKNANIPIIAVSGLVDNMTPPEKPASIEDAIAWYSSEAALKGTSFYAAMKKCGIEPALSLFVGPDWLVNNKIRLPRDAEMYGACVGAYVKLIREKLNPNLKYVSIFSEVNTAWWKEPDVKFDDVIEAYKIAAKKIKEICPDVQLGGWADCWPPAWPPVMGDNPAWVSWETATLRKIKECGQWLDFFDYHAYEMSPQILQEESQAVVNAMHLADGGYRKVFNSEWSYTMHREDLKKPKLNWEKRALRCTAALFGMLETPSYFLGTYLFDAGDFEGWNLFKSGDPNDQYPSYWAYWMFRNLRGKRVFIDWGADEDLKIASSRKTNDTTAVVIFNNTETTKKVTLDINTSVVIAQASWDLLYYDAGKGDMSRISGKGFTVTCPPKSIAAVSLLATAEVPIERVVRDELIFGNSLHNKFDKGPGDDGSYGVGQSLQMKFDVAPEKIKNAKQAFIRVGMLASRPDDKVNMSFGDKTYNLIGDWFQVVPLNTIPKSEKNSATFKLISRGEPEKKPHVLRVSSAVLVVRKDPVSYAK